MRFSKKNWLNFHHNHCSKLAKYTFEAILIGDSIVAGLSRYQNVWVKFLKPLKALNCGIGGDTIEHVLWCALNLPVFSSLKNIVVLRGTNNLLLDSPKDIVDGILEIARSFKTNYSCVNVIMEKGYLILVEKGYLKLAKSIFNSIDVFNDFICRNHNNKFSNSYKMAVSFKLNNANFPPLPFPSASKPVSSISASLPFITACKLFPHNINTRSFAIATNTRTSSVPCTLQDNFFPKIIINPSKSPTSNLACNIPIKHIQRSICKSVQLFQPIAVNVNVVSVPVRHRLHIAKSVFRHQHVSCLAKPIFFTLNVCNVVKYVSSTHNVGKVFPSTHNSTSIPRQGYCPENNNNIANSHLPLTNLLSSSETKSSASS